ncbi:hypothetical protein QK289_14165 [Exiguobacterium antarcticum]|uniref:Na+/glutamate symporter n=1 Tax=Exiguobacterium antarcticum TaxID=132920 RepID=A0ABT6R5S2_9BACL|nr:MULTISPECIES: hypothetical protein [Exiguobacterium]MDI3236155.1 hypothetical protein [Exiguobacterium antarcticum]
MQPIIAFTIIMLIWTVSDYISKKTKALLSSLFVASIIFLIGFKTNLFPEDLLPTSSLLPLGQTVVGMIIVHLGTLISLDEFKRQWKTFLIGVSAVIGISVLLFTIGRLFLDTNYVLSAIAAVSGGTISVIIVQEQALNAGLISVAVFPVLIAALQGLIGFPLTSVILRKEALRIRDGVRDGSITKKAALDPAESAEKQTILPEPFQTTAGTLFVVGVVVIVSSFLSGLTNGWLNTFVIALLLGIALRATGVLKPNVLNGIDAYGLMMLAILLIIFGPLATTSFADLVELFVPLLIAFILGVLGIVLFAMLAGKFLGYSYPMAIAIGLTSLYGFPGTLILSQEAAKNIGETEDEVQIIEDEILPKMVVAGFSTVTITSVFITGILASFIY